MYNYLIYTCNKKLMFWLLVHLTDLSPTRQELYHHDEQTMKWSTDIYLNDIEKGKEKQGLYKDKLNFILSSDMPRHYLN